jgi:enoyl-[acyl-carrier protein] reductase II
MVSAAESPVHDRYKQLVVETAETGTVFLNRWHKPSFRVLATERSEAYERSDERVTLGTLDGILGLYFEGDLGGAFAFGGQVAGRIDRVESVADVIRSTIEEFHSVLAELARRYPAPR